MALAEDYCIAFGAGIRELKHKEARAQGRMNQSKFNCNCIGHIFETSRLKHPVENKINQFNPSFEIERHPSQLHHAQARWPCKYPSMLYLTYENLGLPRSYEIRPPRCKVHGLVEACINIASLCIA